MSLFGKIWNKITGHRPASPNGSTQSTASRPESAPSVSSTAPPTHEAVDVEQILEQLAAVKNGGGNWRTSIVDLLKLLDLDSSLESRTALADELGVHAGAHGSAEQNIALSKAVWRKLAENGGQVPPSLRE